MDRQKCLNEVTTIFKDILDNDSLVLADATSADDVEEWDSLTHIQLVVSLEKHFKIRFAAKEIQGWNNVGEMIDSIISKLG